MVAFNGKMTYEQFAQRKCRYGLQKGSLYGAQIYVLPSTSGQNARGKAERVKHFRNLARLLERSARAKASNAV